ncbi:MAG TPA: hypothetical protein VHB53_08180 [Solirubrobacterales bacterium]|nr:hypothetical protein [Solirubrobacterales bacterium]
MQALSDDQHIAAVEAKVDRLEKKVDRGFEKVNRGFEKVDRGFEKVDRGFERVDRAFEKVDEGFAEMRIQIVSSERALRSEIIAARNDARADFRTLIGVVLAMWTATVLGVVGILATHL